MRITKVSFKEADNKVRIEYQTTNPNDQSKWDDHVLACNDAPLKSFTEALAALIPHAMSICELTDVYGESCKARGVSFSYAGENDTMGATITILKSLRTSNSPLVINTPHKTVVPYTEDGDESNCFALNCSIALENLQTEAEKYLDGERQQQVIKDGDEEIGSKESPESPDLFSTSKITISSSGKSVTMTGEKFAKIAKNISSLQKSDCDEDEDLILQCIEVIRSEQKASVSLFQRRLRLGYTRAARIMDEIEKRGIVGPEKGAEPRDILIDLNLVNA